MTFRAEIFVQAGNDADSQSLGIFPSAAVAKRAVDGVIGDTLVWYRSADRSGAREYSAFHRTGVAGSNTRRRNRRRVARVSLVAEGAG